MIDQIPPGGDFRHTTCDICGDPCTIGQLGCIVIDECVYCWHCATGVYGGQIDTTKCVAKAREPVKIYIVEEWDYEGGYARKAFFDQKKAVKFSKQCKAESVKEFKKQEKCTWAFARAESNDYHIRELEVE